MTKQLRVLIVEDSADDTELLLLELRRARLELSSLRVESALAMSNVLELEPWDVVLIDHSLPGFDAPSALRLVQEKNPDLPVIVVSGTIDEGFAVEMMRAGAADYVIKSNLVRLPAAIEREVRDAGNRRARRIAEEAVRANEEQLRAVFENVTVGIAVTTTTGKFVRCNSAYCRMLGFTEQELMQIDFVSLTHPDDRVHNHQLLSDLLNKKFSHFVLEKRYFHKSGAIVWVRVGVSVLRHGDGTSTHLIGVAEDITRQKAAEQELTQSRDYLRMASRVSHVGAWSVEIPERKLTWSEEVFGIFEYAGGSPPDLGEAIAFYKWESREVALSAFERCARDGTPFDLELEILTAKGNRRWVRSIGESVRSDDGRVIRVQGAHQDVTESKRARERERQLQARLAETLESISDAFYTLDIRWCFTFLNNEAENLLQKTRGSLLGANVWSEFPSMIGSSFETKFRRAVQARVAVEFEEFYAPLQAWFSVKAYPTPEGLAVYFQDCTDRKRAEEAVRESAERFQLLARATNDAIWDWNIATNELWWNDGYENLFGHLRSEVSSSIESLTDWVHPEDREAVVSSLFESITSGSEHWTSEFRYRCKNGSYSFVRTRGLLLRDVSGKAIRAIGGMTDLTSLKLIQEDLARSNDDLQQFAYVASHDLQEPLRAVAGCTQLLHKLYGNKLDERARELMTHTVDGVGRMQLLIRDLLAYSGVDKRTSHPQRIPLANAVQTALENLRLSIEETHAIVQLDSLPTVVADESQMSLLFQNLIGNAIKFSGGKQPHIRIKASKLIAEWQVSVADNGIGIDPEYFSRVFVLFQRLHTRLEYPGTGIGLAVCKKIVDRHGGRIWIESSPGTGSVFCFTLPDSEGGHYVI
ncbi:PAS domain S-box protein [Pirellula sp. SH-Sr6A]|uniref:PAS domain S-box protein n=1 Tax=Pirellula sp. SH-Sr6A TaxID=1632865 RepID=UPI00143AB093|nr:PAS domain S-box protein [Pirellula sp. SH-Sr6A]